MVSLDGISSVELLPVAIESLVACDSLPFDLFIRSGSVPVLYRAEGHAVSRRDLDQLRMNEIHSLFINKDDHGKYSRFLQDSLDREGDLPAVSRCDFLRRVHRAPFEKSLVQDDITPAVETAAKIGRDVVDAVCTKGLSVTDLLEARHDFQYYTHALNVGVFSTLLANQMECMTREEMQRLATGAVLHDLGKRMVSSSRSYKPDCLNGTEQSHNRQHPTLGFRRLCHHPEMTWGQLMIVYQHHERFDGGGYPVGVAGQQIHLWARICTLADLFDAITASGAHPADELMEKANTYLWKQTGTILDKDLVRCWAALTS